MNDIGRWHINLSLKLTGDDAKETAKLEAKTQADLDVKTTHKHRTTHDKNNTLTVAL
ncbi:hypothetical protein AB4274_15370 [Vibrio sp. 10N.261.55.A10]|uniref:hypothetical protein n=1 Tax=Vibrio sp. 10N.261.55.A10 TaxID=3229687 RepID=UPI00354FBE2B